MQAVLEFYWQDWSASDRKKTPDCCTAEDLSSCSCPSQRKQATESNSIEQSFYMQNCCRTEIKFFLDQEIINRNGVRWTLKIHVPLSSNRYRLTFTNSNLIITSIYFWSRQLTRCGGHMKRSTCLWISRIFDRRISGHGCKGLKGDSASTLWLSKMWWKTGKSMLEPSISLHILVSFAKTPLDIDKTVAYLTQILSFTHSLRN